MASGFPIENTDGKILNTTVNGTQGFFDGIGQAVADKLAGLALFFTNIKNAVRDGVNLSDGLKEGGNVISQLKDVSGNRAMFIQSQMSPDIIYSLDASTTPITASSPTTCLFDIMTEGFGGISISLFGTYTGQAMAYEKFDGATWGPLYGSNPASQYAQVPTSASGSGASVNLSLDGAIRVRAKVALLATGIMYASVSLTIDRPDSPTVHSTVTGATPDGVVATGNPIQIGGKAVSTMPAAAANGQAVGALFTLDRKLITQPYSNPDSSWDPVTGIIQNSTVAVTVRAAGAAGIRNYVAALQISHGTLGSETIIQIRSGSGGTVLAQYRLQPNAETFAIPYPIPLKGGVATLLEIVTLTAVTGSINYNIQGFSAS